MNVRHFLMKSPAFGIEEARWLKAVFQEWKADGFTGEGIWAISSSPDVRDRAGDVLVSVFGASPGGLNLTVEGFCLHMARRYPEVAGLESGFRPTRGPAQWVILRDILEEVHLKSDYGSVQGGRGFTRELLGFFTWLERSGKGPWDLARVKDSVRDARLEDLSLLYSCFSEECLAKGVVSFAQLPSLARSVLSRVGQVPQGLVLLGLDGFPLGFFQVALGMCRGPRVACQGDPVRSALLRGPWGRDRLGEMETLLAWDTSSGSPPAPAIWREAREPWEEASLVIRDIQRLMEEEGVYAGDFLVLQRHPSILEVLSGAFRAAGMEYDVPSWGSFRGDILVRFVWDYLRSLEGRDESLLEFLASPLMGLDPVEMDRLYYKASRKGENLREALAAECSGRVATLLSLAAGHAGRLGDGGITSLIGEFLQCSGALARAMEDEGPLSPAERDQALGNLGGFLEMAREIEALDRGGCDPGRLMEDLEDCLCFVPHSGTPQDDVVRVRDLRDARLTSYLFIMGFASPIIPSPIPYSCLLPTSTRRALLGILSPVEPDPSFEPALHVNAERALLRKAVASAEKGAYISRSLVYPGIPDLRPSFFLQDIQGIPQGVPEGDISLPTVVLPTEAPVGFVRDQSPVDIPLGLGLSASYIRTYLECPRRFFFQRLLRLDSEPSAEASLGSMVHAILKLFHEGVGVLAGKDLNALTTRLEECLRRVWRQAFPSGKEGAVALRFLEIAREMLVRYINREVQEAGRSLLYAERGFRFAYGPVVLRGAIDRVDLLDSGQVEVIDYKTGKDQRAETSISRDFVPSGKEDWRPRDFQLPIYHMAMEREGHEVSTLCLYQLRNISKRTGLPAKRRLTLGEGCTIDPSALAGIEESLDAVIKEILDGVYPATPGYRVCSYCDYRFACDPENGGDDDGA